MAQGTWCAFGTEHLTAGTWYQVLGTKHLVYQVLGIMVPNESKVILTKSQDPRSDPGVVQKMISQSRVKVNSK